MLTLEELKTLDDSTILRGADANGNPYLPQMLRLYEVTFGGACGGCSQKYLQYIHRLKDESLKLKDKKMKAKNEYFELKKGVLIPIAGTSEAYSDKNMTDEDAIKILKGNKNAISLFEKFPANWEEVLESGIQSEELGADEKSPRQKELESKTKKELKELFPDLKLSGNKTKIIEAILAHDATTPKVDDTKEGTDLVKSEELGVQGLDDAENPNKDDDTPGEDKDVTSQEEVQGNENNTPKVDDTEEE